MIGRYIKIKELTLLFMNIDTVLTILMIALPSFRR